MNAVREEEDRGPERTKSASPIGDALFCRGYFRMPSSAMILRYRSSDLPRR